MPKTNEIIQALNSGELDPKLNSRIDQQKYHMGCRQMQNFYPLIYGGAERRPGTQFIASQKTQTAKGMVVGFGHSVDDTYVLLFENQVIRVFKDGAQVLTGAGTEVDATYAAAGTVISHWKMNDNTSNTAVDDTAANYDGVATANTSVLHETGKVGTGCLDLAGQYAIILTGGAGAGLTFVEGVDGTFSIAGWVRVTNTGTIQTIMAKWDETTGSQAREWKLILDETNHLKMCIADESLLLDSDLVAHWKLNDSADSTTVIDATGSHNGVMDDEGDNYTSTHSVTGKINNAIDFDGTNDRISVADADDLSFGDASDDSPFSIAAWINMNDATTFPILSKTQNAADEYLFWVDKDDKLRLSLFDHDTNVRISRKYNTAITAQEGSWIHVTATYDASETSAGIKLYINGALKTGTSDDGGGYTAMQNEATDVYIGFTDQSIGDATNRYANGKIDNVMLFNKELTQEEVTALYNSDAGTEDLSSQFASSVTDNALSTGWRYVAMTYDGDHVSWTGATAANYISLYVDSAAADATATNLSTYGTMEDTVAQTRIGAQESSAGAIEKIFGSRIDNLAIFSTVLSAANVLSLYDATAEYEIETPYLTADLLGLDIKQSADAMFIAHDDYEPRRLERLGDDDWTLSAEDIQDGPFRNENTDTDKTIVASATTGSVTLTAVGHAPFKSGTTAGHAPSGSVTTSKSQTGTLFKLVQNVSGTDASIGETLNSTTADAVTSTLAVSKGITWDFTTNGTWGTGGPSTIVLERSYDSGTTYETVATVSSLANKNIDTSETEEFSDAIYRARVSDGTGTGDASIQISIRDTSHIGIVEITSVTSPTVAVGTVLKTLASTDLTHRWSEGAWGNWRGWPRTVEISPEERVTYSGSVSKPLTSWGSAVGEFKTFKAGTADDDAITQTLIGSGEQNIIQWAVPRTSLMLGTVGGEHLLGASSADEALTPTNVSAKLKGTRGSERLQAMLVNDSILFLQRGGRKVRELSNIDTFDASNYRADDLTVFSSHITESGIVDWAYQRSPDPMLWCVRDDGEIAVMMYEKQQDVFSWSRIVLSGTDAKAESVAVIYGGASKEDEVWITVSRTVNSSTVRNVERFKARDWGSTLADAFFIDSGLTDTGGTATISGLDHLEGETVQVFGDGKEQTTKVVIPTAINHWLMNETTATTTISDAEGSDDGTSANNASTMTVTGKIGTALEFNGTDDVIVVTDSTTLDFSTALSVFAWIKPSSLGNADGIVTKYLSVGDKREWAFTPIGVSGSSGKLVVTLGVSGGSATTTKQTTDDLVVANGTWSHVGFTYNAGVVKIYVDGVVVDSTKIGTHITSINNEAVDLEIGRFNNGTYFDGIIDDVRIYDKVLTTSVIGALYNSGDGTALLGGEITIDTAASTAQVGLGYDTTSIIEPMKLDIEGLGLTIQKKVTEGTLTFYKTMAGQWGNSTSNMYALKYEGDGSVTGELYTGDITIPFDGGYTRSGDVIIRPTGPTPMTILSLTLDVGVHSY